MMPDHVYIVTNGHSCGDEISGVFYEREHAIGHAFTVFDSSADFEVRMFRVMVGGGDVVLMLSLSVDDSDEEIQAVRDKWIGDASEEQATLFQEKTSCP